MHPLHIIVAFFPSKPFPIHERKISQKKDRRNVNVKFRNRIILDVGCNNIITDNISTTKYYYRNNIATYHRQKILPFLEVLEGLNAGLAKACSKPPDPQLHFKLSPKRKTVAVERAWAKPCYIFRKFIYFAIYYLGKHEI